MKLNAEQQAGVVAIFHRFATLKDARRHLGALAIREKCRMIDLVRYFVQIAGEQDYECSQCHETVKEHEQANGVCLDCIQNGYEELFNDGLGG